MKLFKRLIIIVFLLLVVSVFARNILVKFAAQQVVKKVTGLPLAIGGLKMGLKDQVIDIDDMRLYNPENFKDKIMAEVPDIYMDYSLQESIKGNIHFNAVKFHLSEFVLIKNGEGQLNIDSLRVVEKTKREDAKDASRTNKTLVIDKLNLRIDRVVYKDYSAGIEPKIQSFNVNINEEFEDIRNLDSVVKVVLVRSLTQARLEQLIGGNIGKLAGGVEDLIKGSTRVATDTVKEVIGVVDDTTDVFKDKARQMKKLFRE